MCTSPYSSIQEPPRKFWMPLLLTIIGFIVLGSTCSRNSKNATCTPSVRTPPVLATTTTTTSYSRNDTDMVVKYLQKYGYLDRSDTSFSSVESSKSLQHAVALFQEYYQLPGKWGYLNEATLNLMKKPRCGLSDFPNRTIGQFKARWPKTHLRWNFHLAEEAVLLTTRVAFDLWAEKSALTFERDSKHPDILLAFREGIHINVEKRKNGNICAYPLDGPGNVLAHAFYPSGNENYTAEIHVDQAEPWYIYLNENPPKTSHLLCTLTHEIGHALGLSHSENTDSVMYAYTPLKEYPVVLSVEDIHNIQQLYGGPNTNVDVEPTVPPTTTTTTTTMNPRNLERDLCSLRRVDNILLLDERVLISHGHQVWSIDIDGKTYDKQLWLTDYMRFLPKTFTRVSGAYQTPLGDIVLFVEKMVYMAKYPSYELIDGWPISLTDFGLPANAKVNAALSNNRGQAYVLYNNGLVGEIDNCAMKVHKHYRIDTIFPGIPLGITTAFRYIDGHLYFVNRKQFYRYNEFKRVVTSAGKMDLSIIGVICPKDDLLEQIRGLLDRLVRINKVLAYSKDDNDDDNEYDEGR